MNLNDQSKETGNHYNLISQNSINQTEIKNCKLSQLTNQLNSKNETNQLINSLSSSSNVECASTSSSGLGTSSIFSNNSICSTNLLSNQTTMNNSQNGSLVNVILPMTDMNNTNLKRAQLISSLNVTNGQFATLSYNNYNTNSSSSLNNSLFQNSNGLNLSSNKQNLDNTIYCQTAFNNSIVDNCSTHYINPQQQATYLITNKQLSNYQKLPTNYSSNYVVYSNQLNLQQPNQSTSPSIAYDTYLNNSPTQKSFNPNKIDLVCDNRSASYNKISSNSNSLIKDCYLENQNHNSSKIIELASSQNSSNSIYSDNLKSKLNNFLNDSLKNLNKPNNGLDLLNFDKIYKDNKINSDGDLPKKDNLLKCSKNQTDQFVDSTMKLTKDKCLLKNKYGFILFSTFVLIIFILFICLASLNSKKILEVHWLPNFIKQQIRLKVNNQDLNDSNSYDNFNIPQRSSNETIYLLNGPRPSLDYSDSLLQQQHGFSSEYNSSFFYKSYSSNSPLARTYSTNQNTVFSQDNNIPQIGPDATKDEQTDNNTFENRNKITGIKNIPKNVTAQIGHTVYLHCIIEPIGDKVVSWIQMKGFQLLTVGTFVYSPDSRFSVKQTKDNDWTLQITALTKQDQGIYECQLNTEPLQSQSYNLIVLVPYAEIQENLDQLEVKQGSQIELTCVIYKSPISPTFVFWYHEQRMINFDLSNSKARGKIDLFRRNEKNDTIVSKLIIYNAVLTDSGNYTCAPSNSPPTSIYVQVTQGEAILSNTLQNDHSVLNRQIIAETENLFTSNAHHIPFNMFLKLILIIFFINIRTFFNL